MEKQSPLAQRPDYLVCTCMGVMYTDIVASIAAGNNDFQALKEVLLVGTGCTSCVPEVCAILEQEQKARSDKKNCNKTI